MIVAKAGVMATPFSCMMDGFDMQFGTNHVGECVGMVPCSSSRQLHMDPKGAGATDILQPGSEHAKVIDMAILDGYHMIL
jgi:hypothetical protein